MSHRVNEGEAQGRPGHWWGLSLLWSGRLSGYLGSALGGGESTGFQVREGLCAVQPWMCDITSLSQSLQPESGHNQLLWSGFGKKVM